ncbi:uncharacterized protein LOC129592716 [Paramacrobiotus metropolitanus]|uniref:uncharacterized protein LOC129592716 n=1 Tax=Paramacrobiotus metropolitanus TaxID=2943436 RepID=UPI0024456845|nr:uncharacterized protein LOC129592716 [Paramacrobiotus metropolitanus]
MYLVGGVDGCLGSVREIKKYLVRALGLEEEMNRPDRNVAIQVVGDSQLKPNLQNLGLTQLLQDATLLTTTFDYKSTTMPAVTKYVSTGNLYTAVGGVPLPSNGNTAPGNLARLSQGDCFGLRAMYPVCAAVPCVDPYVAITSAAGVVASGVVVNTAWTGSTLKTPDGTIIQF